MGKENKKGIAKGLLFAIIPHIGCILFIVLSVLGVTIAGSFFRNLLFNRYIFYILIGLSFLFAGLSTIIYLKTNKILSIAGIKRKYKYILLMFGTTIVVNLLLFFVIFPFIANFSINNQQNLTSSGLLDVTNQITNTIVVDIPCSGHAPLIINELKTIQGIITVKFKLPNRFVITYDKTKTSIIEIINLEIFNEFPAKLIKR